MKCICDHTWDLSGLGFRQLWATAAAAAAGCFPKVSTANGWVAESDPARQANTISELTGQSAHSISYDSTEEVMLLWPGVKQPCFTAAATFCLCFRLSFAHISLSFQVCYRPLIPFSTPQLTVRTTFLSVMRFLFYCPKICELQQWDVFFLGGNSIVYKGGNCELSVLEQSMKQDVNCVQTLGLEY